MADTSRLLVRRTTTTIALFACVLLLSGPAFAQDTRAEEIAAQQAARSRQLTPNVPNRAERTLDWLEGYLTDPNKVYVTFGGIYPTSGFGPGVGVRRAMGHARFNAHTAWSLRNYKRAETTLVFPELAGDRVTIETHARWIDATQVPFYGVGNDTVRQDAVHYGLRFADLGGRVAYKPAPWFRVGGGVGARLQRDREGVGRRPSIERVHVRASTPGLFTKANHTRTAAFAAIDWRESPGYTRRGGLYSVSVTDFRDADDVFNFRRIDADVRQFIPILKEQWVLGLRALVQTTDVEAGQTIPYYLLPALGGNSSLRAYSDFRFQDRHLMLLSAEYRWVPSRVLDMALFVDTGKVASARGDLDFTNLKTGYGIGARFHGPHVTPLRIDVARGREGFRIHLTGGIPF
jgi:hypothetical protein